MICRRGETRRRVSAWVPDARHVHQGCSEEGQDCQRLISVPAAAVPFFAAGISRISDEYALQCIVCEGQAVRLREVSGGPRRRLSNASRVVSVHFRAGRTRRSAPAGKAFHRTPFLTLFYFMPLILFFPGKPNSVTRPNLPGFLPWRKQCQRSFFFFLLVLNLHFIHLLPFPASGHLA